MELSQSLGIINLTAPDDVQNLADLLSPYLIQQAFSLRGEDFAQRLLGHKNLKMTKKYLDSRGAEYVMV